MTEPRRSFYVLLPLLAVIFALLVAELGFALFYPVPYSLERNMYFEPDPYTGFRHRPLAAGSYLNDVPAVANSRGLRDDEVEIPKPPGVFRILVLGDSFTVGANVEQDAAYPQVLETILDARSEGRRVEVVNSGTGGWGPFQYAQFVEYYAAEYEPDLIVLGFFVGNDTYIDRFRVEDTLTAVLGRRVSREAGQGVAGLLKVFFYERSHIARLLLKQGFENIRFRREHCGEFNDYFVGVQRSRLENHLADPGRERLQLLAANVAQLERIRDWAVAREIPFVVFVLPDENQVNPLLQARVLAGDNPARYDFDQPQAFLAPLLDDAGIEWAGLLAPLRADERCLFMNDSHWTPAGHAFVAEFIAAWLTRRGHI